MIYFKSQVFHTSRNASTLAHVYKSDRKWETFYYYYYLCGDKDKDNGTQTQKTDSKTTFAIVVVDKDNNFIY